MSKPNAPLSAPSAIESRYGPAPQLDPGNASLEAARANRQEEFRASLEQASTKALNDLAHHLLLLCEKNPEMKNNYPTLRKILIERNNAIKNEQQGTADKLKAFKDEMRRCEVLQLLEAEENVHNLAHNTKEMAAAAVKPVAEAMHATAETVLPTGWKSYYYAFMDLIGGPVEGAKHLVHAGYKYALGLGVGSGWKRLEDYSRSHLAKMAIEEQLAADMQAYTGKKIIFDARAFGRMWRTIPPELKTAEVEKWHSVTHQHITERLAPSSPDAAKPEIVFTLADLIKPKPTQAEADAKKKEEETRRTAELVKKATENEPWKALHVKTITFSGDRVTARKEDGNWLLTLPGTVPPDTHLTPDGTPKSPETVFLAEALSAVKHSAEITITSAGSGLELSKTSRNISAKLPLDVRTLGFDAVNGLLEWLATFSRSALTLRPSQTLGGAIAKFSIIENRPTLEWSGEVDMSMLKTLPKDQINTTNRETTWEYDGSAWKKT